MKLVQKRDEKPKRKGLDLFKNLDHEFMGLAIKLARKGIFSTSPNPRVGCVIVKNLKVIGTGFHIFAGKEHAEILALKEAGPAAMGSSVYISLEPCHITGKTGPCTQSLIDAGVSRVIIAMKDPNPNVNGKGIQTLVNAGIKVTYGVLEVEAINLNLGFIKRMKHGLPWVRAKMAMSIDGYTALLSGDSKWITGQSARDDGHIWRARSCMVMTGIGTLKKDNPYLNVRSIKTSRQPTKVLIDSKLEFDINSNFFDSKQTIVFTSKNTKYDTQQKKQFEDKNIEIIHPPHFSNCTHHLDLMSILRELANRGCNELHLEAGSKLSGAFLEKNLIDECVVYLAPIFLRKGLPMFDSKDSIKSLLDASKWKFNEIDQLGQDLRIVLRPSNFDPYNFFYKEYI
ncbi:MAG: bifunctional diaminohydroxyphosphoribosylaminopyrimidine deaminase/5-amino-6-(5-phosphoribosylamino)uracil reductase RibD [Burkholderiaceae bacterium]